MMSAPLAWAALPILRGRLRGKRWLVASRINFFLGTYEPEQTRSFQDLVRPGDIVYDIGAHYGYYTLLASELVGASGKVFAVEPCPRNLAFLRRHIALNGCSNVQVLELAIADQEGKERFEDRTGSGLAHLAADGSIEVRAPNTPCFLGGRS
jgi:SAM-dependent methyltransferase